ncbi:ABC transporter permease [Candidatus Caldatribacterium saccharofermentans]|uniref:ABC transporter permease n=1 Tax=Candidatus Caldatribacterium saccharofermentans TaxID=1454753 RepID=A0A7V4TGR5_9BACT
MSLSQIINLSLFQAQLRMATPILFAALGGLLCERVGVVNIGLEGIMLTSAFFGVLVTYFTSSSLLGFLGGLASGFLWGLIIAVLTVRFFGNQIVVGTGVNVFGLGLSAFLSQKIWGSRGASEAVSGFAPLRSDLLARLPYLGPVLNEHTFLVYLAVVLVFVLHFFLFATPWGLRLRAVGENPQAADTAGIDVFRYKTLGVVAGSLVASLGGVFLSLGHLNFFAWGMTSGRGFIGLAAMIFGKWTPLGCLLSSLLFGFADALQMRLQALGVLPSQIILLIPYLVTILVLSGFVGRAVPPARYEPYRKE